MTFKPTRQQLLAARGKTLPDVMAPGLKVVFCGINPGLYTAAIGCHFGRPGNRFWPALYAGGFTPRLLSPFEQRELLTWGYGITNIVARATATADELTRAELRVGAGTLRRKVLKFEPAYLAILGVTAYRVAFDDPRAALGLQARMIGETRLWILPNPSGLNAHYQADALAKMFHELRIRTEK